MDSVIGSSRFKLLVTYKKLSQHLKKTEEDLNKSVVMLELFSPEEAAEAAKGDPAAAIGEVTSPASETEKLTVSSWQWRKMS